MDDRRGQRASPPHGEPDPARCDDATRAILAHIVLPDGASLALSEGQRLVVGSAEDCAVRLEGDAVAHHHCAIDATGRDLVVEGLSREHDTRLNGRRVQRALLGHGDTLRVGGHTLGLATTAGALRQARRERLRRALRWGAPLAAAGAVALAAAWLVASRGTRPDPHAPEATCRASLTSDPDGAWVWVDGAYRGETPLAVHLPAAEEHTVRITSDGYLDWEGRVPPGEADVHLHAELRQRPRGTLVVRAFPRGATVFVGGKRLGSCPLEAAVPAGEQVVRVECQGYEPFETMAAVPAGDTLAVRCVLRHEDPRRLRDQIRDEPRHARSYYELAQALFTRGDVADAVAHLRLALGLVASRRDVSHWGTAVAEALPRLYREPPIPDLDAEATARVQRQLDGVFRAVNAEYAHPELLGVFVGIVDRAGKRDLAERLCEDAMARAPTAVAPYAALADIYRRAKRFDDAEAVLILCEAARRPGREACFALAVAWSRLAPHREEAKARAKAELTRSLDACDTLDERRRMAEDFEQLAWGKGGGP